MKIEQIECSGCSACAMICPKHCITMNKTATGFLAPSVDTKNCIHCGACEKACPMINRTRFQDTKIEDINSYAAVCSLPSDLEGSSSGGAFSVLAKYVISHGGIVYGSVWSDDYTTAYHKSINTIEELNALRGSKYLQSDTKDTFREALDHLKQNKLVLYTGTPCQIKGLLLYIGKRNRDNLITIDVACYGSPSPKIWQAYWETLKKKLKYNEIESFSMTQTTDTALFGSLTKTMVIQDSSGRKFIDSFYSTLYGRSFLSGIINNPACTICPAKNFSSGSDITIGDFWNIAELTHSLDVQKGVSVILTKTEKGKKLLEELQIKALWNHFIKSPVQTAIKNNHGLYVSEERTVLGINKFFWDEIARTDQPAEIVRIMKKYNGASLKYAPCSNSAKKEIKRILYNLGLLKLIQKIKSWVKK